MANRRPIQNTHIQEGTRLAGRLYFQASTWYLRDQTSTLALDSCKGFDVDPFKSHWAVVHREDDDWSLVFAQEIHNQAPLESSFRTFSLQKTRFRIINDVRTLFNELGFVEVDTPCMVDCPSMEPYLDAFSCGQAFLRTSPELHMKRLLCAGWDQIYQIAPSFRDEPKSNLHQQEFLMLEWYRSFAGLDSLIDDVNRLLRALAPYSSDSNFFLQPAQIISVPEVFNQFTSIDLRKGNSKRSLYSYVQKAGLPVSRSDTWDDLFFKVFLNFIEPQLGHDHPVILTDYPASQSALAKLNPESLGSYHRCFRFELFMKGIECANAFYELCDPIEYQRRFDEGNDFRSREGKLPHASDPLFFGAIQQGMPPSAGIALGIDRLIMLLTNTEKLSDIMPQYLSKSDIIPVGQ